MSEELVVLYSSGSLPGIPGDHSPGTYFVDYDARTIRSVPVQTEDIAAQEESAEEPIPEVIPVPNLPEEPSSQPAPDAAPTGE